MGRSAISTRPGTKGVALPGRCVRRGGLQGPDLRRSQAIAVASTSSSSTPQGNRRESPSPRCRARTLTARSRPISMPCIGWFRLPFPTCRRAPRSIRQRRSRPMSHLRTCSTMPHQGRHSRLFQGAFRPAHRKGHPGKHRRARPLLDRAATIGGGQFRKRSKPSGRTAPSAGRSQPVEPPRSMFCSPRRKQASSPGKCLA